jgi:hypothetical protein
MGQRVSNYDPDRVSFIFAGVPVEGFADGTFISVEQNEDAFVLAIGSDGEACRAKSNNRSAKITLTLLQTSRSNQLLTAFYQTDIISPSGDGIAPLLIKDNSGTSLHLAEKAWITKIPAATYAREAENREWVFETNELINNVGGAF